MYQYKSIARYLALNCVDEINRRVLGFSLFNNIIGIIATLLPPNNNIFIYTNISIIFVFDMLILWFYLLSKQKQKDFFLVFGLSSLGASLVFLILSLKNLILGLGVEIKVILLVIFVYFLIIFMQFFVLIYLLKRNHFSEKEGLQKTTKIGNIFIFSSVIVGSLLTKYVIDFTSGNTRKLVFASIFYVFSIVLSFWLHNLYKYFLVKKYIQDLKWQGKDSRKGDTISRLHLQC